MLRRRLQAKTLRAPSLHLWKGETESRISILALSCEGKPWCILGKNLASLNTQGWFREVSRGKGVWKAKVLDLFSFMVKWQTLGVTTCHFWFFLKKWESGTSLKCWTIYTQGCFFPPKLEKNIGMFKWWMREFHRFQSLFFFCFCLCDKIKIGTEYFFLSMNGFP